MEKKKVSFSKDQVKVILFVLLGIAVLVGVIWYDGFQSKNLILGLKDGEATLASMTRYENLPWDGSEYKLRAVIFCGGHKIFVEDGKKMSSSEFKGCGYSLAENTQIEILADIWKGEGFFAFIPVE
jgi:hypothetical protein